MDKISSWPSRWNLQPGTRKGKQEDVLQREKSCVEDPRDLWSPETVTNPAGGEVREGFLEEVRSLLKSKGCLGMSQCSS